MRAARYYGPGDIRIEQVPEPRVRPGTVAVRVAWCGICGSDLHEYLDGPLTIPAVGRPHPLSGATPPITLGHEFAGTVAGLGAGVDSLALGDRVAVEPLFVCGQCAPCREGRYNICPQLGFYGFSGYGGGLSELVVVDAHRVFPVGDIPLDQAALIEPLAVAHHAVRRAGARAGQVALVAGAGPIGLLCAAVLKAFGVTTVLVELSAARKQMARSSGVADHVLDPREDDVPARVRELAEGGCELGFECAGADAALATLLDAVRPTGVVVNVALWSEPAATDLMTVVLKEIDLRGSAIYANEHAEVIRLVQQRKIDLAPFITHRIGLDELVEKGMNTLIHHNDTAVKILVDPTRAQVAAPAATGS